MAKAPSELAIGDPAPDFSAVDETGKTHSLEAYRGKTVVLYFYPKDDTPGCTVEACDFRDNHKAFLKKGAAVLGVSPDDAASHLKFKEKFDLPFPLLADEDKTLCKAYGVWKEKSMYGRNYMGVERSTFVIGPDGKLAEAIRKVSPKGHAAALLTAL
ncbi:MAG: thioredoxin-dependent thiol peroxidase [Elusimicrobiota bacterium]